ncbi:MAG: DegT/DnrJ/EryC1/StrS family aminotransferase [Proteobacteria bacterium]|nr:DegT/DnrJ/EryC1/StrS family aminotransferase [Pseudomonadota bacterium]
MNSQSLIPLAKPSISRLEIDAVNEVLKSGQLSRGPYLKSFENAFKEIYNCEFATAVSSGTAGLILALQALSVQKSDEVITVSFTVPATVNAIIAVGATPVLIDIDSATLGMDVQALKKNISAKTKAVIVVHAFGKAAKIDQLKNICKFSKIPLIEDACEAIGNTYQEKLLGNWGTIAVFGFYPNKQITTGEGGMVICNDREIDNKIRRARNHGRSMNGDYCDQQDFGWNFRLSELHAALGLAQLKRLDQLLNRRVEIAAEYKSQLEQNQKIELPEFSDQEPHSSWFVYVIKVKSDRDALYKKCQQQQIQCGRYFAPVHLQAYWQNNQKKLSLPVTEKIASQTLALPFFYDINHLQIERICLNINQQNN